jgi:site-specific recombinase XerD
MDVTARGEAEEAVAAFLGYLRRRGHPVATQRQYGRYLKLFAEWAGERELEAITARDIELGYLGEWHDEWERKDGRAPSENTTRNHIQALRALYKFLERFDFLKAPNPMTRIEAPKIKRRGVKPWLRPDEEDALLAAHTNVREQVVVWFLRFTGVRWGEAMTLRQKDVDLVTGSISITHSKTDNGIRQVPILPELRPVIARWYAFLEERGLRDPNLPFFTTRLRNPMTEQQAIVLTKRVAARAGVQPVSPHGLRRTFGSSLINQGVRLEVVSKLLGHGSTTVTEQSYAELLNATIVQEVMRIVAA